MPFITGFICLSVWILAAVSLSRQSVSHCDFTLSLIHSIGWSLLLRCCFLALQDCITLPVWVMLERKKTSQVLAGQKPNCGVLGKREVLQNEKAGAGRGKSLVLCLPVKGLQAQADAFHCTWVFKAADVL